MQSDITAIRKLLATGAIGKKDDAAELFQERDRQGGP